MEIWGWIVQNRSELFTDIGIIGGLASLWFTNKSLREQTKAWRVANLLTFVSNLRELTKVYYENVPLHRVLDPGADVHTEPVNFGEETYARARILHLFSAYKAMQDDLTVKPEGLRRDIQDFFALPIPKIVWGKMKPLQNADFTAYIDECLNPQ